ncbi:MAG: iron ABC transporter substrate-binding protein [Pseudonocardiaceae bacterium]
MRMRGAPLLCLLAAVALSVPACGGAGADTDANALTLYNAQHQPLAKDWVADFTAKTGIKVNVRSGGDFELANQIVAEGASSPADVFITENSPAMALVSGKDLFAPVEAATRDQVPAQYSSTKGDWVGIAGRSTSLVYNPSLMAAADLPQSITDLATPAFKDRFGIAPGGADFQAIVSAVFAVDGEAAGLQWVRGLKDNAKIYQNNIAILKAVNSGQVAAGVIYHYYWFQDRAEAGENSAKTELKFFDNRDAGGFLSISGAGVLKSSKHAADAQRLVAYLSGRPGQELLANSKFLEYTIGAAVPSNPKLKPFSELSPPDVDLNTLNGPMIVQAMQQVGLL